MPISAPIGTAEDLKKVDFPAPPKSGFYKVKITKSVYNPVKKAPDVTMIRLLTKVVTDADGEKAEGFAEWMTFIVPQGREEEFNNYGGGGRSVKQLDNLIRVVLGAGDQLDNMRAQGKASINLEPERWEGVEAWAKVRVVEEEFEGEKRMKGRIDRWMTEEQVRKAAGLDFEEDEPLEEVVANKKAAKTGAEAEADIIGGAKKGKAASSNAEATV